jgi:hypothetical protein
MVVKSIRFLKDLFFHILAILVIVFVLFFFYNLYGDWMNEVVERIRIKELPEELRRF